MQAAPRDDSGHVDISDCEREPIHIPGLIQPHGVLLAADAASHWIEHVSANAAATLGRRLDQMIGSQLADHLPAIAEEVSHLNLVDPQASGQWYAMPQRLRHNGDLFEALVHQWQGLLLIELEPATDEPVLILRRAQYWVDQAMRRMQDISDVIGICQFAAFTARALTGFDRVMIYRFHEDDHGSVIAESKQVDMLPYLGLHYPASDIPPQARRLYLLNRLRLIVDVQAQPVPIMPAAREGRGGPIDLSFSVLRSVSPVHLEYLRNMGVAASMSVSIVRDGKLWGLIALHHRTPRFVNHAIRNACHMLGQCLSMMIDARQEQETLTHRHRLKARLMELGSELRDIDSLAADMDRLLERMLPIAAADGMAIGRVGDWKTLGSTPSPGQLDDLAAHLPPRQSDAPVASHHLASLHPPAAAYGAVASGVLAMPILWEEQTCYLLWFRREVLREVTWAGDPHKPVRQGPEGQRLHPRFSFEAWKQQVTGQSRRWQNWEMDAAAELRHLITQLHLRQRSAQAEAQRAELHHAVQFVDNALATIGHELRTPLAGLRLLSEMAMQRSPQFDAASAVNLHQQILRMSNTVNRMLLAARLIGAADQWRFSQVSLASVAAQAMRNVEPLIDRKNVNLSAEPIPTDLSVNGDAEALQQVLIELLQNAARHTSAGEIQLSIRRAPGDDALVHMAVSDTGSGLAPDELRQLGEPFVRSAGMIGAEGATGSHLGLGICKAVAAAHGGTVHLKTAPGQGTLARVTLRADLKRAAPSRGDLSVEIA